MASLSDAGECLKEKAAPATEEAVKKPSKKKRKKNKKKSSVATVEGEAFGLSTAESVSNVGEKPPSDDKTILAKEPEANSESLHEEKPQPTSEESASKRSSLEDESKPHESSLRDVSNERQQNESNSKKKKKKKKKTPSPDKVLAEEKDEEPEMSPKVVEKKENFVNHEKPIDSTEVTYTSAEGAAVDQTDNPKSSSEQKLSCPATQRKKKKKKKKAGYFPSDALSEPQNDSDKETNGAKVVLDRQVSKNDLEPCSQEKNSGNDLSEFTHERSLLKLETRQKNNWSKICKFTYSLVLDTLRKLFRNIHPTWSNIPDDAKNLDKGKMILKSHENARFSSGDINRWDVSLITTILLYSKKCAEELKLRPGYEDAVRTIKELKNQLISHTSSEKMPDDEFKTAWDKISSSLITLGVSRCDIDEVQSDDTLESAKFYRDMFLQELAYKEPMFQNIDAKMDGMGDVVAEKVVQALNSMSDAKSENPAPSMQDLSGPEWDAWLHFCDKMKGFDHEKNNYILITDGMSSENVKHFSVLKRVAWKLVLDFDPSSEEHGMYHAFRRDDGQNSLINMITPEEIRRNYRSAVSLAKHIDSRKTQWLFLRGREGDSPDNSNNQDFNCWKTSYLKHISGFLRCCSDPGKIDKHKPVVCLILPFRDEAIPFLKVTLERLEENFDECLFQFVGVKNKSNSKLCYEMHLTELTPALLGVGLRNLLEVAIGKEYPLPTFQAKLPAKLKKHEYLYLQEYLHVMYKGCEDRPKVNSDKDEDKLTKILNEHKDSFLSGNWISFLSLYDNHDAKRELGNDIRNHIQRLLNNRRDCSAIIEIHHSPGTGGTTIARRVLWDLHDNYPCAIAKLEDYRFDFDDDFPFINALAERIGAMQEICGTTPLILLDGNHSRIQNLSSKLVRVLNGNGQKVLLLSCMHAISSARSDNDINTETTNVHARFFVNAKLEESAADLRQFKEKYKDFIDKFKRTEQFSPQRVFHFPLLAMLVGLEGFDSKLKKIINESFDGMDGIRKEIAAVVAFVQLYASEATPASLLYLAFKQHVSGADDETGITYEDINQLITDNLLSLMIPAKLSRKRNHYVETSSSVCESYTFQHPRVATLVLQRYYSCQKRTIVLLTRDILKFPIFQDGEFFSLWYGLFIRNRSSPSAKFSILFEKLKSLNTHDAADIFQELAKRTGDATVFAYAARFHTKSNPPHFKLAKELIAEAFTCENAQSRKRMIHEFKGNILQSELKFLVEKDEISTIQELEDLAGNAVESYKYSENWPVTYPWPLLGEVKVWISCVEWITKNKCRGDTSKALEYVSSEAPPFFHSCVSDSLLLLDVVDDIVEKETNLTDPGEVQRHSNDLRMALLKTFSKGVIKQSSRRNANEQTSIIRECKALCTEDKFPRSSAFELNRLKAYYILGSIDNMETTTKENIEFLIKLLEDLVLGNKQNVRTGMARHLMKICLFSSECYPLDKGLRVVEMWIQESSYDPWPYFYKMMIAFLMVLDGNQVIYRDVYHRALEMCQQKSQNHCRKWVSTHYLKKTGEGMNRLMTKATLVTGEPDYSQKRDYFWTTISRKKLKECKGRIRIRSKSVKHKQVYIELVENNIELHVAKNADVVHKIEREYTQGTIVYFVVSFNLDGPVANGITVEPVS